MVVVVESRESLSENPFGIEGSNCDLSRNGNGTVYAFASGCRCAGGRIWSVSLRLCRSQHRPSFAWFPARPFFTTLKAFACLINGLMN
jgi:hypothetical protein